MKLLIIILVAFFVYLVLFRHWFFNLFKRPKKNLPENLETLVERGFLSKAEMLLLKKERAIKEWEEEIKPKLKRDRKKL